MPRKPDRAGGNEPKSRSRPRRRLPIVRETSAGGLVLNADHTQAVIIGRISPRGQLQWLLPKGHIESGETPEQTAVREVAEETGIRSKTLQPLGLVTYWFVAEKYKVRKTVHHFLLEATGGELSDEDIEVAEVAWVPLTELEARLAYSDERALVRKAAAMLEELLDPPSNNYPQNPNGA
jgi:8-oxo-dGTP pyrophosphatase MutT (NUDIX family)